jgi:hypothetical protein
VLVASHQDHHRWVVTGIDDRTAISLDPTETGTRNRMAAYRPEGPFIRAYCRAVNEDECMAQYLLTEAALSGTQVEDSARGTTDRESE